VTCNGGSSDAQKRGACLNHQNLQNPPDDQIDLNPQQHICLVCALLIAANGDSTDHATDCALVRKMRYVPNDVTLINQEAGKEIWDR